MASAPSSRSCRLLLLATLALPLGGCVIHEHRIGLGPTGLGSESERQYYMLFGLVSLNDVDVQRMADNLTSYSITTKYSFVDMLMGPLLLLFTVTSRTVTVTK